MKDYSYKEALEQILTECSKSVQYSRSRQNIHNIAMIALGLTYEQRDERHTKIMRRAEEYKENCVTVGVGEAKRIWKASLRGSV